ncbi:hypothetical protein [Corynebacterium rhinophilum]|uniref:hypothetical protein n=1 Tax=Corynebacterium rhinophilum TaxID=3050197 RepID=UPI00254F0284|nr:hypothetical protein [Corynebacterium sp. MSK192]MDK8698413.1 hypothetical protein [Corynebacterium sp. MSK192]
MSNQDRAAKVIDRHGFDPCREPECIAQDLADAGLLAAELPDPTQSFSDGTKGWFVEDDEGRDIGSIYIFNGEILLRTAAGRVKGAPAKMRKIGLALLAATNHAEENQ